MIGRSVTIVGCGAHARKVSQAAVGAGWQVLRYLDDRTTAQPPIAGCRIDPISSAPSMPHEEVIVAIGDSSVRRGVTNKLSERGFAIGTVVHTQAYVAPDAMLGAGVVVLACAIVESRAHIGDGVIIDVGAIVDHDATVAAFVHLRPGCIVSAYEHWPSPQDSTDGASFGVTRKIT